MTWPDPDPTTAYSRHGSHVVKTHDGKKVDVAVQPECEFCHAGAVDEMRYRRTNDR